MLSGLHHDLLVDRATFLTVAGLSALQLDKTLLVNRIFAVELHGQGYILDFFLDDRYDRRQLQGVCKVPASGRPVDELGSDVAYAIQCRQWRC